MPVQIVEDPSVIFEAISSEKPTIIHCWATWMGDESPLLPMLEEASENRPDIDFYTINSGFIAPPHSENEVPLTVFYAGGPVDQAPFDPDETQQLLDRI